MIRDICKDVIFLAQKSQPALPEDRSVAADLENARRFYRSITEKYTREMQK